MHRLPVIRHRTARRAWAKYRSGRHPVEETRWHLFWLLLRPDTLGPRPKRRPSGYRSSPAGPSSSGGTRTARPG